MADNNIAKNKQGYGYKYTDISAIHEYLESKGITYYQYIELIDGNDYVMTVPTINGKELPARRGCRVVDATLQGIKNPAQEQGSAITYARRYSLLMAFGLATEDDDAQSLSKPSRKTIEPEKKTPSVTDGFFEKKKELADLCGAKDVNAINRRIVKDGLKYEDVEEWLDNRIKEMKQKNEGDSKGKEDKGEVSTINNSTDGELLPLWEVGD